MYGHTKGVSDKRFLIYPPPLYYLEILFSDKLNKRYMEGGGALR
jgi:hypothetical protein